MTTPGIQKVLVIDDDTDVLALAEVALSDIAGFTTVLCERAHEALACVEDFRPDIILLDLLLPDSGACATLTELRTHPVTRETPVVIFTAQLADRGLSSLQALGISGVIRKPFEPETLAETLSKLCQLGGNTADG